jgi:hypothetical protein
MKGGRTDYNALWHDHIQFVEFAGSDTPSNHCILIKEFEEDQLCEYEKDLLEQTWEQHKDDDKWDLVNLTHEFPEWDKRCKASKSSSPIRLATIFEKGFHESADVARERASEVEYFEEVCG